jgi:hypothetical protein
MQKARKARSKISLFPPDQRIDAWREKLPVYPAHDLRSLVSEAKKLATADVDLAFISVFRRRNENQTKDLLRRLGVDPARSDAGWRGFFMLATIHHGVGHIAWDRPRTNRNSATWTLDHDRTLLREVTILGAQGLSERHAIKKLVADPEKRRLFPYRQKRDFSTGGDQRKREAALRARLQKLKASSGDSSLLSQLLGTDRDALSSIERKLHDLDTTIPPVPSSKGLVKNDGGSKGSRS